MAQVLQSMAGPEWMSCVLRRDPNNEYDPNAIEVHVVGEAGHVGFVPADLARILAPMIEGGTVINAWAVEVRVHPDSPDKPGLTVALQRAEHPTAG
jgi:hypothetical protein